MADTSTPNLGLTLPGVGDTSGANAWGGKLNSNFSTIDNYGKASEGTFSYSSASNVSTASPGTAVGASSITATGTVLELAAQAYVTSSQLQNAGVAVAITDATASTSQQISPYGVTATSTDGGGRLISVRGVFTTVPGHVYNLIMYGLNETNSGATLAFNQPFMSYLNT